MGKYRNFLGIIIFLFLVTIDQLSKYIIRHTGGFYICNTNIAFGIRLPEIIFWLIWTAIILFILTAIYKKYFIHNTLFLTFILAGALGNMIDRLAFGCVIDFIDFKVWPMFNLADSFITLGVCLLIIKNLKSEKKV